MIFRNLGSFSSNWGCGSSLIFEHKARIPFVVLMEHTSKTHYKEAKEKLKELFTL